MPKDDWAKARAKNVAKRRPQQKRSRREDRRLGRKGKWIRSGPPPINWTKKITEASTDQELTAIAKSLAQANKYSTITNYRYLIRLGRNRRRALNSPLIGNRPQGFRAVHTADGRTTQTSEASELATSEWVNRPARCN
jgi:hypothetical protein